MKNLNQMVAAKLQNSPQMQPVTSDNGILSSIGFSISALIILSVAIPLILQKFSENINNGNSIYRFVWAIAFIVNCICVSIPGRFDGQMVDGKISVVWRSAFAPSGWAFAIWGIIYIAELLATSYISISPSSWNFGATSEKLVKVKSSSFLGFIEEKIATIATPLDITDSFKKASLYWLVGNFYQCLWCYAFRPKFKSFLWIPASLLAAGAFSLFGAHRELSQSLSSANTLTSKIVLALIRFPISLHAAWLTAASLLNLNGWAAVSNVSPSDQLAIANASAFTAGLFGAVYTLYTKDPFVGLTFAWALSALADKTKNKADVTDTIGVVATQALSTIEFSLSTLLLCISIYAPFSPKLKSIF